MGMHFKKLSKKSYELANGKIIVCPFDDSLYMPQFLTVYDNMTEQQLRDSVVLVSSDGKFYVDARHELADYFAQNLELLVNESRVNLEGFRRAYAAEFKGITFKNIDSITDVKKKGLAIGWCFVPAELNRRTIEQNYYKACKIKAFRGFK